MSYVFIQSEPGLWTAGFYDPKGKFQAASDHDTRKEAENKVIKLNGGSDQTGDEMVEVKFRWLETTRIPKWEDIPVTCQMPLRAVLEAKWHENIIEVRWNRIGSPQGHYFFAHEGVD